MQKGKADNKEKAVVVVVVRVRLADYLFVCQIRKVNENNKEYAVSLHNEYRRESTRKKNKREKREGDAIG